MIRLALFLILFQSPAFAGQITSVTMLSAATTTSTSEHFTPWIAKKTFYCKGTTSAGAGAATILIEGIDVASSVTADWVALGTITLTLGTTSTGDGFASDAAWRYTRARISAISGTTATVYCYMGADGSVK
jgi:hypothetical protein